MIDTTTAMRRPAATGSGDVAMSRLADRIASMAPPLDLSTASIVQSPVQSSPAVVAALATSRAISARAAERARRSRSVTGLMVDGFVAVCSAVPFALVALALRLVMARLFFFDGQTRVEGPRYSVTLHDFDFSAVLPLQVKAETFSAFLTQYASLPIPPVLGAYLLGYAEFILPVMLVLGFGTRLAALGLLVMTALIQIYVMPEALWTAHIYWASMLLVLVSLGAGKLSIDQVIRLIARR